MSEKKYKTFADLKLVPIKAEPNEQIAEVNSILTTGATGVSPVTGVIPVTGDTPVAPVKNFQKVTNTITKEAIPNGIFKSGKCKQLYDVLYSLTRGAIRPSRIAQVSKPKLRQMSDISSEKTLNANLLNLQLAGLIKVSTDLSGKHGGNIYEVFTPEEIPKSPSVTGDTPVTVVTPVTPITGDTGDNSRIEGYIVSPVTSVETTPRNPRLNSTNIEEIKNSKTLLKTNKENDDERYRAAFTDLEKVLNEAVENLTGREASESDRERWKQVADILAAQLELIASRTTISNAPAVLAEHLHRQLNSQRALERMGLITPNEARAAKRESLQNQSAPAEEAITADATSSEETIPDLYLCPDCDGTTYWNPDGQGRQAGCPHPRLEEARERAALEN